MPKWRIIDLANANTPIDMGVWAGETTAHAYLAMCRSHGYGPELVWIPSESDPRKGFMHDGFCGGDGILNFRDQEIAGEISDSGWMWQFIPVNE